MNVVESRIATTQELVSLAQQRRIDLSAISYDDWSFLSEGRFLSLWRKEGRIHYMIQGPIKVLPESFRASARAFRGMWHETGSVADLEQALKFLRAWLIDRKEVDDLPQRNVRSEGIG